MPDMATSSGGSALTTHCGRSRCACWQRWVDGGWRAGGGRGRQLPRLQ